VKRQPEIDWLRALAVALLVPFHTAIIFCPWGTFPIKSPETARPFEYFVGLVHQFHMPLLFVLSGIGTGFALRLRTPRQYVKERFQRLFIPLLFGTLVVVPPQLFLERLQQGRFQGSFLDFYPQFFRGVYPAGNFSYGHLWFVAYLFVFSLVGLKLFLYLWSQKGRTQVGRLASLCQRRGRILLLAAPIVLSEATLRASFPGLQNLVWDWANVLSYFSLFALGYLVSSDDRFWEIIDRDGRLALVTGVCVTLFGVSLALTGHEPRMGYSPGYMGYQALRGFNTWALVVAILALGRRYLQRPHRLLPYVAQATYPFYILHQTVLAVIGFYTVRLSWRLLPKSLFIATTTFVVTLLLHDLLVRRNEVTRFLFGVKGRG